MENWQERTEMLLGAEGARKLRDAYVAVIGVGGVGGFAAEALARIRKDDGQLIPPALFIPIAEKNGQINLLGEQVLRKVCDFIRYHDMDAIGIRWINVNLSPIQCMDTNLPEEFMNIIGMKLH